MCLFGISTKPPICREPKVNDKVFLLDGFYETLSDGKECAKLARMPYCTVDEYSSVPIGENGDYTYVYEVYVKETGYMVGLYGVSWCYLEEKHKFI